MLKKSSVLLVLVVLAALALAACGGGGDAGGGDEVDAIGDAAAGEALFAEVIIGAQAGCSTCHSLTPDEVLVGPSMAGIGSRAGSRIAGVAAEDYLRQSILDPEAYLVDEFASGLMPQVWEEELSEEQLNNLIAYLLTLN